MIATILALLASAGGKLAAVGVVFAGLIAAVFAVRSDAKRDQVKEDELAGYKDALKEELERNARDEEINGAADLAALARASGVVRPEPASPKPKTK